MLNKMDKIFVGKVVSITRRHDIDHACFINGLTILDLQPKTPNTYLIIWISIKLMSHEMISHSPKVNIIKGYASHMLCDDAFVSPPLYSK